MEQRDARQTDAALWRSLPGEDRVAQALRALYESLGYRRYRAASFESYDFYLENKSFVECEAVLPFTDASGRLLALKPDVTMSIVKRTRPDMESERLYYVEQVFRARRHGEGWRELGQMGVEFIGASTAYAQAEVVMLAARSLAAIGPDWTLSLGHTGLAAGLLAAAGATEAQRAAALDALRHKNAPALEALLPGGAGRDLAALAHLDGAPARVLEQAAPLCKTAEMKAALAELESLAGLLRQEGFGGNVQLDLSMSNDLDYYTGLVLQGCLRSAAQPVLAGGRYDGLMRRCGKPQAALGFALDLNEVERACAAPRPWDVDAVLLYDSKDDPALVLAAVRRLAAQGTVRAETALPAGVRAGKVLRLLQSGETEVIPC